MICSCPEGTPHYSLAWCFFTRYLHIFNYLLNRCHIQLWWFNLDYRLHWIWNQLRDTPIDGFIRILPGKTLLRQRRPSFQVGSIPPLLAGNPHIKCCFSCLFCSFLVLVAADSIIGWHWNLLSLAFQYRLKTSISPGILQVFSAQLGLLRYSMI